MARIRLRPRHAIVALGALGLLALQPALARANLEDGHPEWYGNNKLVSLESRVGVVQWGPVRLESVALGEEIECVWLGFGYVNNEGTPAFGKGQIEGWAGQGDARAAGSAANRECHYNKAGVVSPVESWMTDEPRQVFEPVQGSRKTPLSVPWNFELLCVEHEAVESALVRIGVPTGAPSPPAECKSEAARAEEIAGEESRREACFATTVPEGCIKVNTVVPDLGLEEILEGSLEFNYVNGFTNGLHPSTVKQPEGEADHGQLHLRSAFASTSTFTSFGESEKNVGFGALQLITAK
jgi:hypothetical protein